MGLTTSREAIGRQASSIKVDPDVFEANGVPRRADLYLPALNGEGDTEVTEGAIHGSTCAASLSSPTNGKKRKCEFDEEQEQQPRLMQQNKKPKKKAAGKKASAKKKAVAVKSDAAEGGEEGPGAPLAVAKINPHKARILVGKQALASIKEGTRIFIKSGEGNGGDTWWDSGTILKIHERGKPYEVEWQKFNNMGEEVDTGVEKRIILPVTYSLAGLAAEALTRAPPGDEAAATLARKRVLFEARIGSWCIHHPQEPWGTLDPFEENCKIPEPAMPFFSR